MQKTAQILHYDYLREDALGIVRFAPQENTGLHVHDFHELVIVFGGEARHVTVQEEYTIGAGDVFLIRPGDPHGYADAKNFELVNILYYRDRLNLPLYDLGDLPGYHAFFELEPEMRRRYGFRKHLQVSKKNLDFLDLACRELSRNLNARTPGHVFSAAAVFMQIIACVAGSWSNEEAAAAGDDHALLWKQSRLVSDLERHWNQPFDLNELARRHGMSASTLYRRFVRLFGKSPLDYLLDLRVSRAAELLERTNQPISDIAATAGFRDSNYFSRCFKLRMGVTPGAYRRKLKN